MTDPNTSVTYDVLRREIGREMGWSRDPADWSDDQISDAADMIAAGCRRAYYPAGWNWRFLTINFTFDTVANQQEYDLPDDCAALAGTLTYEEEDGAYCEIRIVSEQHIRLRYQNESSTSVTGYPQEAAVRFSRPEGQTGSRQVLAVWPAADGVYAVHGQCVVQPNTVSAVARYPYGSQAFHECLLNAVLMMCEQKLGENDGKYARAFAESLVSAKKIDDRSAPDTLGYNGDPTESNPWSRRERWPGRVIYEPWG